MHGRGRGDAGEGGAARVSGARMKSTRQTYSTRGETIDFSDQHVPSALGVASASTALTTRTFLYEDAIASNMSFVAPSSATWSSEMPCAALYAMSMPRMTTPTLPTSSSS